MRSRRILWLHGIGAVIGFTQVLGSQGVLAMLQGLKVVINLAGLAAALGTLRMLQRSPAARRGIAR